MHETGTLKSGQLEVIDHEDWYIRTGKAVRVLSRARPAPSP